MSERKNPPFRLRRREDVWRFAFLSFFRDDLSQVYESLKKTRPFDAEFSRIELRLFILFVIGALVWDWKAVLFLVSFYCVGSCRSSLNNFYEHCNANPDVRSAWGVSTCARVYNRLWFSSGHHAEHHYRPSVHWARLPMLHPDKSTNSERRARILPRTSHAFGFLDPGNHPATSLSKARGGG